MSVFHQILELCQEQAAALARGDLEAAVRLLNEREPLVTAAGAARAEDVDVIHEILRYDRQLSGAIRERMIDIRNRARATQSGRAAVAGYRVGSDATYRLVDQTR